VAGVDCAAQEVDTIRRRERKRLLETRMPHAVPTYRREIAFASRMKSVDAPDPRCQRSDGGATIICSS
jgi:hypothetical protein